MESKDLFHVEQRQYMWVFKTMKLLWLVQLDLYLCFLKKLPFYIEINMCAISEMFLFLK